MTSLNYEIGDGAATVLEVAHDRTDPTILGSLVNHFVCECAAAGIEALGGEHADRP